MVLFVGWEVTRLLHGAGDGVIGGWEWVSDCNISYGWNKVVWCYDKVHSTILGLRIPSRGGTMCARETSFSMGSLADLTIADKRWARAACLTSQSFPTLHFRKCEPWGLRVVRKTSWGHPQAKDEAQMKLYCNFQLFVWESTPLDKHETTENADAPIQKKGSV